MGYKDRMETLEKYFLLVHPIWLNKFFEFLFNFCSISLYVWQLDYSITGRGGTISNSSRENALGHRFESPLGITILIAQK